MVPACTQRTVGTWSGADHLRSQTIAVLLIGYATVSRRLPGRNLGSVRFVTTAGLLVAGAG